MASFDLFEAMRTQRAIRRFKPDPVPPEQLRQVLESAVRAPSGGNRQPWVFMVITDPDVKRRIGEYYQRGADQRYGPTDGTPAATPQPGGPGERMAGAPVLIMACVNLDESPEGLPRGGYIYPAVQNLMLAARGLGLGTVITTLHRRHEAEVKELLGIPANFETACLIPMGYPDEGEHFGGSRRKAIEEVTFGNHWGRPAFD